MFKKDLLDYIEKEISLLKNSEQCDSYIMGKVSALNDLSEFIKKTSQRRTFTETKLKKLYSILKKMPEIHISDLSNKVYGFSDKSSYDSLKVLISKLRKDISKENLQIFTKKNVITLVNITQTGYKIYNSTKDYIHGKGKCLPGSSVSEFWS